MGDLIKRGDARFFENVECNAPTTKLTSMLKCH